MARFKVEYSYGKKPAEGSVIGSFGSHDNVIYQWKNDELEFPDENSAMAFFNKIVNSWENEEIYEKDRLGKLHYRDVVVKAFQEGKWVPVKSANYEQWFKANKERKFAEKAKQQQPADADNNVMENKKQLKLQENELREIVECKVREKLKELFERDIDDDSYFGGGLPDDYRYDGDEEPEEFDDEPEDITEIEDTNDESYRERNYFDDLHSLQTYVSKAIEEIEKQSEAKDWYLNQVAMYCKFFLEDFHV